MKVYSVYQIYNLDYYDNPEMNYIATFRNESDAIACVRERYEFNHYCDLEVDYEYQYFERDLLFCLSDNVKKYTFKVMDDMRLEPYTIDELDGWKLGVKTVLRSPMVNGHLTQAPGYVSVRARNSQNAMSRAQKVLDRYLSRKKIDGYHRKLFQDNLSAHIRDQFVKDVVEQNKAIIEETDIDQSKFESWLVEAYDSVMEDMLQKMMRGY